MSDDLVFVDTNILVYAFDRSNQSREELAEKAIAELLLQDRLRLSTQVLQEFYVTMTRKVREPWSADEALSLVDDLSAWPVSLIDVPMIRESVLLSKEAKLSFWDALIVTARGSERDAGPLLGGSQ
ncbi:MAG TPA: PIN domain-containing protein [Vicinamibacteria bacterium]|nr:PIN domain-containing protein [Vicinamibacteria bacterium]